MKVYIVIEGVKISDFLNRLLQGVLGYTPAIILIFFCEVNIFLLFEELRQKILHIL
jgi:hypothetical protein